MSDSGNFDALSADLEVGARLVADSLNLPDRSEHRTVALRVFTCSDYAAGIVRRYPDLLSELFSGQRLERSLDPAALAAEFSAAAPDDESESAFMRRLRLFRHRELVRIIWRDMAGLSTAEEMLQDLSASADLCIRFAVDRSLEEHVKRHGEPLDEAGKRANFIVVAMGKLGGHELNFSSDIDLIFLYSAAGQTAGARELSNEEFFKKVAQHFIRLVSKQTVDGFAYRVDARLRPFGDSGPLACSVASLEDYLVQQGRDWERYAWVKARIVTDWSEAADFAAKIIRPFVYRRYLDFGVFASLRDMKSMIEREGRAAPNRDNIKLGTGGIREIEFIVQTLQLVRGGNLRTLRERSLLPALAVLETSGLMESATVADLTSAYLFLRMLENRLQAIADRQTHELPASAEDRVRLCLAMQAGSWEVLLQQLNQHRAVVAATFNAILRHQRDDAKATDTHADESEAGLAAIAEAAFEDSEAVLDRVRILKASSVFKRMDDAGRQRLESLLPALLMACGRFPRPQRALEAVLRVVESIGRRSAYIALLNENAAALDRLVTLCGTSDFLASQVAAHPLLLDELLDPRMFSAAPTRDDFVRDLDQRLRGVEREDSEQRFEALRNFQQAAVFRVAVADMSGALPLMKVSDRLTEIAELVLNEAISLAIAELAPRYGSPMCIDAGKRRPAGFAIAGYGKLGGLELGYGSDLDIVYMHDSTGEAQQTDGADSLDNTVYFSRLARRITHILTMPTPTGALYEVDTRLRPSGNSGLLVTSLSALDRYQAEDAWTWEHQALLRARAVAGDADVCTGFESLRLHTLTHYVNRDSLHEEVLKMRERMRGELNKGNADNFDLKQGEGGIIDIEFQVQYLVLLNAPDYPALIVYSDNIRQLEALEQAQLMTAADAGRLRDTYRAFRERLHHLALAGDEGLVPADEYVAEREHVLAIWRQTFGLNSAQ
jgi:glutamate-ammonia-ligase adenylyltransferase